MVIATVPAEVAPATLITTTSSANPSSTAASVVPTAASKPMLIAADPGTTTADSSVPIPEQSIVTGTLPAYVKLATERGTPAPCTIPSTMATPVDAAASPAEMTPTIANSAEPAGAKTANIQETTEDLPRLSPYIPKKSLHCTIHRPTLEELKSCSFSDYVRNIVLPAASIHFDPLSKMPPPPLDDPMRLREGLAKVVLPEGFQTNPLTTDTTGRGPLWQPGTKLGDFEISSPIQQNIRGIAGVYEFTFTEQRPISMSDFRTKADEYRKVQVGRPDEEVYDEKTVNALERAFWKRLGPTMPPPWYGADQAGTLFHPDDDACGWALGKLDSCLQVLSDNIPGVTSPYLYAGQWSSIFCAHTEDMNLCSINYLMAGAPKFWYAVAESDVPRFVTLCQSHFSQQAASCDEFLRHKRCLLSPQVLQRAGIRFQTAVQYPGEAILTMPASIHFGFNMGFNLAEATNFGLPEWIPFGRAAQVCICQPLAVRIQVDHLAMLLEKYEKEQRRARRGKRVTWREWGQKRRQLREQQQKTAEIASPKTTKQTEFWVEVLTPKGTTLGTSKSPKTKQSKSKKGRSRKIVMPRKPAEIWHLAKPITRRKLLEVNTRVLCMVTGQTIGQKRKRNQSTKSSSPRRRLHGYSTDSSESEEEANEDEQCFAGQIVEIIDDHVRVHIDGLIKTNDFWVEWFSHKLFLDGGRWDEEANEIPELHYWQEMDSTRRCL